MPGNDDVLRSTESQIDAEGLDARIRIQADQQIPRRTLVFGGGYVGMRVARLSAQLGNEVLVTTRNASKAKSLSDQGFQPLLADWNRDSGLDALVQADSVNIDRVLIAVSFDSSGKASRFESQVLGLQRLLRHLPPTANVVYISTTGVYHQSDGRWVDETSPTHPRREGGRVHLEAEQSIRRWGSSRLWTILRLSGIYGPDRIPLMRNVKEGRAISTAADGYLNLIHVQDAAAAVLAAWFRMEQRSLTSNSNTRGIPSNDRLYVVSDDQPVIRRDFYGEIARLCNAAPPKFESKLGNNVLSPRSSSHKRIWNRRMKNQLIRRLLFPTYREGLAQIFRSAESSNPSGVPPIPTNS